MPYTPVPLTGGNQAFAKAPTTSGGRLDVSAIDKVLTLANGMTAGYGVNDGKQDNWPLGYPGGPDHYGQWPLQPKRVGYLRNVQGSLGIPNQYTLYFMYNPNEIDVQWAMNGQSFSPMYLYGSDTSSALGAIQGEMGKGGGAQTIPGFTQSQSVSWVLYFDRTYDMMYGPNGDGIGAEDDRGVLKDVAALYNLMGAFLTDAAMPVTVPSRVVFGRNKDGQLWGFTGYISTLSIKYGVFRHDMIPSMAEVDLTLTCTYVASEVPAGGGANGADKPYDPNTPPPTTPVQLPANAGPDAKAQGPHPTTKSPIKPTPTNPSGLPGAANEPQGAKRAVPYKPPPKSKGPYSSKPPAGTATNPLT